MGLGMLLGLVNRMWVPQVSLEESKTPTKAEKKRVSNMYVFLFLLMLLIPLAAVNWVNMSNGMAFYCTLLLPCGFLLLVVKLSWYFSAEIRNHWRFVYMQLFVFS